MSNEPTVLAYSDMIREYIKAAPDKRMVEVMTWMAYEPEKAEWVVGNADLRENLWEMSFMFITSWKEDSGIGFPDHYDYDFTRALEAVLDEIKGINPIYGSVWQNDERKRYRVGGTNRDRPFLVWDNKIVDWINSYPTFEEAQNAVDKLNEDNGES